MYIKDKSKTLAPEMFLAMHYNFFLKPRGINLFKFIKIENCNTVSSSKGQKKFLGSPRQQATTFLKRRTMVASGCGKEGT